MNSTPVWKQRPKRATATERGYDWKWRKIRQRFLDANPLCATCLMEGVITVADVVHHKIAHKGDKALLYDMGNLESLCARHHNSDAQAAEKSGRVKVKIGLDGWPTA